MDAEAAKHVAKVLLFDVISDIGQSLMYGTSMELMPVIRTAEIEGTSDSPQEFFSCSSLSACTFSGELLHSFDTNLPKGSAG